MEYTTYEILKNIKEVKNRSLVIVSDFDNVLVNTDYYLRKNLCKPPLSNKFHTEFWTDFHAQQVPQNLFNEIVTVANENENFYKLLTWTSFAHDLRRFLRENGSTLHILTHTIIGFDNRKVEVLQEFFGDLLLFKNIHFLDLMDTRSKPQYIYEEIRDCDVFIDDLPKNLKLYPHYFNNGFMMIPKYRYNLGVVGAIYFENTWK